jgi:hypothetical protein
MRLLLQPAPRDESGGCILILGNQFAVGERDHAVRHAADHLGGKFFVRIIVAGKPVPRLVHFALRPEVRVAILVAHRGRAEIEPFRRFFRRVSDLHPRRGVGGNGVLESHDQLLAGILPAEDRGGRFDLGDRQIDRIKLQLAQRFRNRLELDPDRARDTTPVKIRCHVERLMRDVDLATGRVLPGLAGGLGFRVEGGLVAVVNARQIGGAQVGSEQQNTGKQAGDQTTNGGHARE